MLAASWAKRELLNHVWAAKSVNGGLMVEVNQQYAYFSVVGDFDPGEITARVGLQPTECWRHGDICPRRQMERKFSRWSLHSRLGRDQGLESHIQDVLAQLDVHPDDFRAVSQQHCGVMQLVGYFFREYPGLHFERAITERLGWYSLTVDFDFYGLYSHHREDT
jgi:hypothetical protein